MCKKHKKDHCVDVESSDDRYAKTSNLMARAIGFLEIQVYYYLAYAIAHSKYTKTRDGQRWLAFSIRKLEKFGFPGVGRMKIHRIVTDLLKIGILMARDDINTRKNDKTFLYAVNVEKFNELKKVAGEKEEQGDVSDCATYEEAVVTESSCPSDEIVTSTDDVTIDSYLDMYIDSPNPQIIGDQKDLFLHSSELEPTTASHPKSEDQQAPILPPAVSRRISLALVESRSSQPSSVKDTVTAILSALKPKVTDDSLGIVIPPAPSHELGDDGHTNLGRRADGTNPRALGTDPRTQHTNPRFLAGDENRRKTTWELEQDNKLLREKIARDEEKRLKRQNDYIIAEKKRKQNEQDNDDKQFNCEVCGGSGEVHALTEDGISLGMVRCTHPILRKMNPEDNVLSSENLRRLVREGQQRQRKHAEERAHAQQLEREQRSGLSVSSLRPQRIAENTSGGEGDDSTRVSG